MKYLTAEDILVLHALIVDEVGGSHGVRDIDLLASLVERPKSKFGGQEQYKGISNKAAVYLDSLARYHVFVDGNKRAAIVASARFLFLNGRELTATNKDAEEFVLRVVLEKPEIEDIAKWLKTHSRKIKK